MLHFDLGGYLHMASVTGLGTVVVRGIGDVGSAVAHRLYRAGYAVLLHDGAQPATTRRGMAFTDAIFDGSAVLEEVTAVRVDELDALQALLRAREVIPVVTAGLTEVLDAARPTVLVDARMRKRSRPEPQRGLAPLMIGLGPTFTAGENVDLAVETSWGDDLGRVIERGPALPLKGEPRPIGGHARDRYVYAPLAGIFRTVCRIGQFVLAGELIAHIGATPLHAPLDGALRGLTHDGVPVAAGTKVIEVDPRGAAAVITGIGERPGRIAAGVLRAVESWYATW